MWPDRHYMTHSGRCWHSELIDVIENGTARRVKGAFAGVYGASPLIGGKTGTGDLRFERFAPGGGLIESHVLARTATFMV